MIALKHTFLTLATATTMMANASVVGKAMPFKNAIITPSFLSISNPDEKPIKDDDGKKKKTIKRDDTTRVIVNRSAIERRFPRCHDRRHLQPVHQAQAGGFSRFSVLHRSQNRRSSSRLPESVANSGAR